MNRPGREVVEQEIIRAITADEKANTNYYEVIKRFIPRKSSSAEATLDSCGLKEIETAWIKLNDTSKCLRRAYMKLYCASLR
jgi:hypothetical protein